MQRQAGRRANVGPVPFYAHWFHPPELTPLPGDAPIPAHAIAPIVNPKRQIMVGEWLPPPISNATRDALHGLPVAVKDNRATKDMRPDPKHLVLPRNPFAPVAYVLANRKLRALGITGLVYSGMQYAFGAIRRLLGVSGRS